MFQPIATFNRRISQRSQAIAWIFPAIIHVFQPKTKMKKQKNIENHLAIQEELPYPRTRTVGFAEFLLKKAQLQRAVHQLGVAN